MARIKNSEIRVENKIKTANILTAYALFE